MASSMRMLAVFAEFESNTTKERTAAGMARARENGSQVGRDLVAARIVSIVSRFNPCSAFKIGLRWDPAGPAQPGRRMWA